MKLQRPEMVLIDLDGTMVDSVPDLAYCVDEMMKRIGMPSRGETKVRDWVGNGVERLVRRALIDSIDGEPDDALFEKAYPVFLELYAVNHSSRSQLYPGVREGLEYLKSSGIKVGCVTNKAAAFTEPMLEGLGIAGFFGLIVSGDTLPKKKPDPAPLLYAAEFFKVDPSRALMVGDSISDVKAARAAGFSIACVPYGYNHGNDIRDAAPDAVIGALAELKDHFEQAA